MRKETQPVWTGFLLIGLLFTAGAEAQKVVTTSSSPTPNAPPAKGVNITEIDVTSGLTATGTSFGTGVTGPTVTLSLTSQAGVTSFNNRTNAVVPASGDYSFSLISGTAGKSQLPAATAFTDQVNSFAAGQSITTGTGVVVTGLGPGPVTAALSAEHTNDSATGATIGVYGFASKSTDNPTYGVIGKTLSSSGVGVQGLALSSSTGTNVGVYGQSSSTGAGAGVFGYNPSGTGGTFGVFGRSDSTGGTGVLGFAFGSSGTTFAVDGQSASPNGTGVRGWAYNSTGTNYGVYGRSDSTTGYGVYSQGNAHVEGNLSVSGTKNFKIDHPLDPANKYLLHASIESSDVMNLYNGNIVLNKHGEAWVTLPDWFEMLNRDFRYQLTAIGAPGPKLYVAEEIQGNRFKIAGGREGMKVSWQVTGVRQDAYVEANRMKVEQDKPDAERGYFLHPEAYGQPKEKGIEYAHSGPKQGPTTAPPVSFAAAK